MIKLMKLLRGSNWFWCMLFVIVSLIGAIKLMEPEPKIEVSAECTEELSELKPTISVIPMVYTMQPYESPAEVETTEAVEPLLEETSVVTEDELLDDYIVPLSDEDKQLIYDFMDVFDLDFDISNFYSMIWVESRYQNTSESCAGACGITQIMPSTFRHCYSQFSEEFPEYNGVFTNSVWDVHTNLVMSLYYIHLLQGELGLPSLDTDDAFSTMATAYNRGTNGAKKLYNKTGSYASSYSALILQGAKYLRENKTFDGIE